MEEQSCPNCAGVGPEVLGHGDYKCRFCGTLFRDDKTRQQKIADERRQAAIRQQELQYQAKMTNAIANQKRGRGVFVFAGVMFLLLLGVIGYIAKNAMDEQKKMQDEIMKEQQKMQEEIMKNFEPQTQ